MKKQYKIMILIALCLAVAGLYIGKNTYLKKQNSKENNNIQTKNESNQSKEIGDLTFDKPALVEFSTIT